MSLSHNDLENLPTIHRAMPKRGFTSGDDAPTQAARRCGCPETTAAEWVLATPRREVFTLADPSSRDEATPPIPRNPVRHPDAREKPAGSAQSSHHDDDDDLTAEDIDYLKAQQVWGRMGRGGL